MQFTAKQTWWFTLGLVALQGLDSIAWSTLGISPNVIAGISQADGYLTTILLFVIHGSVPGVAPVNTTGK